MRTYVGFSDCNGYNATLGGDSKKYKNINIQEMANLYKETMDSKLVAKTFNIDQTYVLILLKEYGIKTYSRREISVHSRGKKIYQLENNTYKILNIFECITDAYIYLGKKPNCGNIGDALHEKRGHHRAYGFLWYFEDDYKGIIKSIAV